MQYDLIAEQYNNDISKDLSYEKLQFEVITLPHITDPTGWKVLDVGCGSGIHTEFLASNFLNIQSIIGVDISQKFIKLAESTSKDTRCEYVIGDMHALRMANSQFNFIYSRYAIHYSSNIPQVMNEIYRVCKPGGRVYLQVVHPIYELFKKSSKDYGSSEEANFTPQTTTIQVTHPTHTVAEYINSAIQSGLTITDIEERFGGQSNVKSYRVPTVLIFRLTKII
jgi:ubiquinone/menaquinone biosynthesis C-methylase UbiE